MHISELQAKVEEFCSARDWDQFHDIKELAIGVSTEAAELLEIFRFRSQSECEEMFSKATEREAIENEMVDVLFFLLRIAGRYQVDLSAAFTRKMEKNAQRYPVEKARGSNQKY